MGFVRSRIVIGKLRRDDFGAEIGCEAKNTDLVDAPKATYTINMLRNTN